MNKYTVVGITDEGQRVAEWVEADNPEQAEDVAAHAYDDESGENSRTLEVAGVFAGHLTAVDR